MSMTTARTKIEMLMDEVDRSLLRENLKLTPSERLAKFVKFMRFTKELRNAGAEARYRIRSNG